ALPLWPVCTLAGSGLTPVSHWNTVLLPEPAKPAMPTFMPMTTPRPARGAGFPALPGETSSPCPLYNRWGLPASRRGRDHARELLPPHPAAPDAGAVPQAAAQRRLQVRVPRRRGLADAAAEVVPRRPRPGGCRGAGGGGPAPGGAAAAAGAGRLGRPARAV